MRLAFLVFRNCHVMVINEIPEDILVDEGKGEWFFSNKESGKRGPWKLGHARYINSENRYGTIGVYDLENFKHLDSMVRDAINADQAGLLAPLWC